MLINEILIGLFTIFFGASLIPLFYKKLNLKQYEKIEIILPIIFFILTIMSLSTPSKVDKNYTNVSSKEINKILVNEVVDEVKENEKELTSIELVDSNIELDIEEIKSVDIALDVDEYDISKLRIIVDENPCVESLIVEESNKIMLNLKATTEGENKIYVESDNEVASNTITVKVIDKKRIEREQKEAEEQARLQAEAEKKAEEARIQAEEQAKKEVEEQARIQAEEQAKKESEKQAKIQAEAQSTKAASQSTTQQVTSQVNNQDVNSETVLVTPTGKHYHLYKCGKGNYSETTKSNAISRGLTPCSKCY